MSHWRKFIMRNKKKKRHKSSHAIHDFQFRMIRNLGITPPVRYPVRITLASDLTTRWAASIRISCRESACLHPYHTCSNPSWHVLTRSPLCRETLDPFERAVSDKPTPRSRSLVWSATAWYGGRSWARVPAWGPGPGERPCVAAPARSYRPSPGKPNQTSVSIGRLFDCIGQKGPNKKWSRRKNLRPNFGRFEQKEPKRGRTLKKLFPPLIHSYSREVQELLLFSHSHTQTKIVFFWSLNSFKSENYWGT